MKNGSLRGKKTLNYPLDCPVICHRGGSRGCGTFLGFVEVRPCGVCAWHRLLEVTGQPPLDRCALYLPDDGNYWMWILLNLIYVVSFWSIYLQSLWILPIAKQFCHLW